MIVAAGLSPAWQQIIRFEKLRFGEVNRVQESLWCSSGKVLNVALALVQLGAEADVIAPLGGSPFEQIEREFSALGIQRHWVRVETPTRICTTIVENEIGRITELVENAGLVTLAELDEFRQLFSRQASKAAFVVLSGSLPVGAPKSFYAELLADTKAQAIVDARGEELLATLKYRPLLVKPNREELAKTVGRPLDRQADLLAAMRELNERGADWVVVTSGAQPVIATHAGKQWQVATPTVEVVNPIGSGDCFSAALAWGLMSGEPMERCLSLAVAAGAENATRLLPAQITRDRILEMAERIVVEPLI